MDWIDLVQAEKCLALVNMLPKLHVPSNVGYLLPTCWLTHLFIYSFIHSFSWLLIKMGKG